MKAFLKTLINKKLRKKLRGIYSYILTKILGFLSFLIPTDDKQILFISYTGDKFDDSPKSIFEYMISHKNYSNYNFVWAFCNCDKFKLPSKVRKIKYGSLAFYLATLKSKYIISNATFSLGIYFKGRNTIYLNTWHGSALKK